MNIFVTAPQAVQCAINLDDKRVVKMVLETAQIVSTVLVCRGADRNLFYKPTHENHPCVLWAGVSKGNMTWLIAHGVALSNEYTYRFGKIHASYSIIHLGIGEFSRIPNGPQTPFVNCTAFKEVTDVHEAYRQHLISKWDGKRTTWTRRAPPDWY